MEPISKSNKSNKSNKSKKMEIATEPDIYMPSMDEHGNYVDKITSFTKGLRCPCGTRRDKVYKTTSLFSTHIKCDSHKKWIIDMNHNKSNYYAEAIKTKETVRELQLIIGDLNNKLANRDMTIEYLTNQLHGKIVVPTTTNLLD